MAWTRAADTFYKDLPSRETTMNGKARGVDGRLPRLARLIFGTNELRRPCDRIEGAILLAVSAAFLAVLALAVLLAGHIYSPQRAAAARLRPTVATLSEPGAG